MRIHETLTKAEKISLLNGNSVGIFDTMIQNGDSFYSYKNSLCLGYYTEHSANKTISPAYNDLIDFIGENSEVTSTPEQLMGNMVRSKFLDKWTRIYNALCVTTYNPLYENEKVKSKDGDNLDIITFNTTVEKDASNKDETTFGKQIQNSKADTESVTYGNKVTKEGEETDTTTYDVSSETNGTKGTKTTTERSNNEDNKVFGFNSSVAVGDTSSVADETETVIGLDTDNTDYSLNEKTGTETVEKSYNEENSKTGTDNTVRTAVDTETNSGKDTVDYTVDEEEKKTGTERYSHTIDEDETEHGRTTSPSELLQKELDFRSKEIFFDIVYRDIDSITTLQIYM